MYPKSLKLNYARDCVNLHNFVSRKCLFLPPPNLKHPHHKICLLVDTISITCNQENPWDVMNVTAFHKSNGTVNCMSAHCVDKGNLDMPRKIVLTITMMMELKAILILKEGKPVTITENVETPKSFTYLFWNLTIWLWKFFPSFSFLPYLNMFPIAFTWTFEFIPSTSVLEVVITPTFEQYYPPPILTKHPVWYSLDANLFILLWGILYGLHFQNSPFFQEIVSHGEKQLVRLPFNTLKNDLFNHFLVLLYQGSFQLNHLTRDDWIDLGWLCVDWYFPGQTAIIIWKFCDLWHRQLPPMQWLLVLSIPTQQIISD